VSTLRILCNHNIILAYVHSRIGSTAVLEHGISVAEASSFLQQATAVVQEDMLSDAAQQIASVYRSLRTGTASTYAPIT
jgi:uncharacterized DUF497 family protein